MSYSLFPPMARGVAALTLLIAGTGVASQFVAAPSYDLSWNTIDAGGGLSAGGGFTLSATIGQPDAGSTMTGGGFTLAGGFWAGGGIPAPLCQADIAPIGSPDGMVNVDDLLAVVNGWGPCANPANCPADIAPPGPPPGDDVVNVDDLLAVLNAWGLCPSS